MEHSELSIDDRLKLVFDFVEEDLAANRMGVMSRAQKYRATYGGFALFISSISLAVLMLVILVVGSLLLFKEVRNPVGILLGLAVIGVFAFMGWRSYRAGKLRVVKSITTKVRFLEKKKKLLLYISDRITLPIEEQDKELFIPNEEYQFYYCEMDKSILSLERISKE